MKWQSDSKIYMEIQRTKLAELHSLISRLSVKVKIPRHPDAGVRTELRNRLRHEGSAKEVPLVSLQEESEFHAICVIVLLANVILG